MTNNRLARIHARIYWLKMPEYASMNFLTIKKSCQIGSGQARLK
jgi:hypothetical protein